MTTSDEWDCFSAPTWWWLSFADDSRPTGEHFLGVVVVQAPAFDLTPLVLFARRAGRTLPVGLPDPVDVVFTTALQRCNDLGINPGGQVVGWVYQGALPVEPLREKLLTKNVLIANDMWGGDVGDRGGWENFQ